MSYQRKSLTASRSQNPFYRTQLLVLSALMLIASPSTAFASEASEARSEARAEARALKNERKEKLAQIKSNTREIKELKRDIRELKSARRDDGGPCDCHEASVCEKALSTARIAPDVNACESLYKKSPKGFANLPGMTDACRQAVESCGPVNNKLEIARKELRIEELDRESELLAGEAEDLEIEITGAAGGACAECAMQQSRAAAMYSNVGLNGNLNTGLHNGYGINGAYGVNGYGLLGQRQPTTGDYILGGLQVAAPLGMLGIQAGMHNRGLNAYQNGYNNYLQQCMTIGVPCSPPNGMAYGIPGGAGFYGPGVGLGLGVGLNGMGMNGMGMNGVGLNGGVGLGVVGLNGLGYNPYGLQGGVGLNVGLNTGMYPGMYNPYAYNPMYGPSIYANGGGGVPGMYPGGCFGLPTAQGGLNVGLNTGWNPYATPYANVGLNTGLNTGLNGWSPAQWQAGLHNGLNPAWNTGYNPYATPGINPYANAGLNTGWNTGMNTGIPPYATPGINPYANAGLNTGWNTGYNPYAQAGMNTGWSPQGQSVLNAQRAQDRQTDIMLSQQQVYEAQYRAQMSMQGAYASAGTGYYPGYYPGYASGYTGAGLNAGIGLGLNLNFGL